MIRKSIKQINLFICIHTCSTDFEFPVAFFFFGWWWCKIVLTSRFWFYSIKVLHNAESFFLQTIAPTLRALHISSRIQILVNIYLGLVLPIWLWGNMAVPFETLTISFGTLSSIIIFFYRRCLYISQIVEKVFKSFLTFYPSAWRLNPLLTLPSYTTSSWPHAHFNNIFTHVTISGTNMKVSRVKQPIKSRFEVKNCWHHLLYVTRLVSS